MVDERRILISEAMKHLMVVEEGGIRGIERVILRDGKVGGGIEGNWDVWEGFEREGGGDEKAK